MKEASRSATALITETFRLLQVITPSMVAKVWCSPGTAWATLHKYSCMLWEHRNRSGEEMVINQKSLESTFLQPNHSFTSKVQDVVTNQPFSESV